jgi:hypothetical protein
MESSLNPPPQQQILVFSTFGALSPPIYGAVGRGPCGAVSTKLNDYTFELGCIMKGTEYLVSL